MLSRPEPPVALVRAFLVCPARSTAASSTGFSGRGKFFLARGPILPRVRYSGASFADRAASGFPLHNPCPAGHEDEHDGQSAGVDRLGGGGGRRHAARK